MFVVFIQCVPPVGAVDTPPSILVVYHTQLGSFEVKRHQTVFQYSNSRFDLKSGSSVFSFFL